MITRLKIHGYKTLHDLELRLSPVTVLVGANNVGKTNVVRAIELLAESIRIGNVDAAIANAGGMAEVATLNGDGVVSFSVEGVFEEHEFSYLLGTNNLEVLTIKGPSVVSVGLADGVVKDPWQPGQSYEGRPGVMLKSLGATAPQPIRKLIQFLAGMRAADFSPARLREASLPEPGVQLGREGENLAAVLDRLQGERPAVRRRINEEVRRAVPDIDEVTTITQDRGRKVVGVSEGDHVFKADHISDGIMLFIGLSTVVQMSGGATLVAIEELERGIHPRRIRESLDQILRVAQSTGSQFLLTTHSPILLSEFRDSAEAVLILERSAAGGTTVSPLSQNAHLINGPGDVSLGDLWYSGVLGGVPNT